ncbi:lipopolysaccharide biosynthesis protein [Photobacterium phosphoreum]|uniref:lipopolysaccharide biosynthesis protein n=1 Tax=Photobacterium phosphoreum TaxID=659 RepID=UPI0039AEB537
MMNKLFGSSAIYMFSNILNAIIPFLLLPILTRNLSHDQYGQLAIFQTLLTAISSIIGLSVYGAASRKFYDKDISEKQMSVFNGSCLQILICSTLFFILIITPVKDNISSYLSIPSFWLYPAIGISFSIFVFQLRLGQWQVRRDAIRYGFFQVGQSLLNISLSLVFVLYIFHNANGRIYGQLIAISIFLILSIISLYKDNLMSFFSYNLNYIKEALNFGVPLIPHTVGFFLITSIDRFVINDKLGLSDAAIYMVAVQISLGLALIFDAVNKAYVPWLFDKLSKDFDRRIIVKYTYVYFAALFLLAIMSYYLAPYITIIVAGDSYKDSANIVFILCLGQIFGGMYLMVTNYIFYSKSTKYLSMATILSGLLNIILLFVLIDHFGLEGAAISFAIARFVQFLLTWFVSSKCIKMPWFYMVMKSSHYG